MLEWCVCYSAYVLHESDTIPCDDLPHLILSTVSILARLSDLYRRFRAFLGRGFIQRKTEVVTVDEADLCARPIFVIGTHRSGTSLLRRVLDSHPHIACPPESFFLQHYTSMLRDESTFTGLSNLGFSEAEARKGIARGARYFHEQYRRAKEKPRWADKTPQYVFHLDTLQTLFGPACQYVFIMRHPLDVAFSIWKRGWTFSNMEEGTSEQYLPAVCRYVVDSGEQQLDFMRRHPQQCHRLYYDRLVDSPAVELRALCRFLEEPWDERMLAHHEQPHDFGTEDPVARGTKGFKGSFGNWQAWDTGQIDLAVSILRPLMERLGYSKEHVRVASDR